MPNRLAREGSPYLRQHAGNPVDWYPWDEEALERARAEDKLILLSIGYAACHWCHVMAHESFEDPATAAQMNRDFVCIKVDREERPDLDAIYMDAVQAMVGHGGWPLNVFLTPDGRPFFGGTYFPPTPRHGMPSFRQLLASVATTWRQHRADVLADAGRVVAHLQALAEVAPSGAVDSAEFDRAVAALAASSAPRHGGFGQAPKFPSATCLEFLLAHAAIHGSAPARDVVLAALRGMAAGGINDQIGGGFHRYSVDERWLVPHFEKMLYDQAMLARVYLDAFLVVGDAGLRDVATETLDFVRRELTSPDGAFYSSLDADSEGGEGRFYTWTPTEIAAVLDPTDAEFAERAFGISASGNYEGRSVPRVASLNDRENRADVRLRDVRRQLFAARERRPRPGLDNKIVVSWNGLMIRALAAAGAALGRTDYVDTAARCARHSLGAARATGGLTHVVRAGSFGGSQPIAALLDDHAALAAGLLALYSATLDSDWLSEARALADAAIARFVDPDTGAAYDTPLDGEPLVVRPRNLDDSPTPAGAALLAEVLFRIAPLVGDDRYANAATRIIANDVATAVKYPLGHGQLLLSAELLDVGPVELAIVGSAGEPETQRLIQVAQTTFAPRIVLAAGDESDAAAGRIALLVDRRRERGVATAWVCREGSCLPPITDANSLGPAIDSRAA